VYPLCNDALPLCNDELNLRHQEMAQPLENVVVPRMLLFPPCPQIASYSDAVDFRPFKSLGTEDDIEIISTQEATGSDALAIYYAHAQKVCDRDVVYNPVLGLAVESLPQETSLDQLWKVI
jgi:hypothetical protein